MLNINKNNGSGMLWSARTGQGAVILGNFALRSLERRSWSRRGVVLGVPGLAGRLITFFDIYASMF